MSGRFVWIDADELLFAPPPLTHRFVEAPPDPLEAALHAIRGRHDFGDAESTTQAVALILKALGKP